MGELGTRNRAHIAARNFGLPEKARTPGARKESGNYPMPDRAHAVSAKGRAKAQLNQGNLTRAEYERIVKKADRILGKDR
jgi:hypothetical protein